VNAVQRVGTRRGSTDDRLDRVVATIEAQGAAVRSLAASVGRLAGAVHSQHRRRADSPPQGETGVDSQAHQQIAQMQQQMDAVQQKLSALRLDGSWVPGTGAGEVRVQQQQRMQQLEMQLGSLEHDRIFGVEERLEWLEQQQHHERQPQEELQQMRQQQQQWKEQVDRQHWATNGRLGAVSEQQDRLEDFVRQQHEDRYVRKEFGSYRPDYLYISKEEGEAQTAAINRMLKAQAREIQDATLRA